MLITNFKKLPYQISNIYKYVCTHLYQYKKKTHHIIPYHNIPIIYHAYIYMYHVLSPVYPVYPHTIASHMFVCMYVCMHACMHVYPISHCISIVSALWLVMYHPVLVTSVLSSFIIYRGVLKMVDPQTTMAFNTKMVIQDWMKRGYPPWLWKPPYLMFISHHY